MFLKRRNPTEAVRSISTFGNVLVRRSKETIIQSDREFGVTWGKTYKIITYVAIIWLWTKWSITLISIELQHSNRPVYICYWPGLNACRKTRIALTSPRRSCDANFISLLVAARVISPDSSSSCLVCYYVDLCEDCTVITAIHIRFITPVEIESFECPLARNKSKLALRYYYYSGRASA